MNKFKNKDKQSVILNAEKKDITVEKSKSNLSEYLEKKKSETVTTNTAIKELREKISTAKKWVRGGQSADTFRRRLRLKLCHGLRYMG